LQEFLHSVHVRANSMDFHPQVWAMPNSLLISTTIPLNHRTSKMARGSKPLVPPTLYVLKLQEPSQTMPLQENINYNFSRRKTSSVCVVYILSRQEGTFCMNVWDIMGIGTLKKIRSIILSCSWVLIP